MAKVFLGGTCNGTDWRSKLIPILSIEYFNPVVDEWTPEAQDRELEEREACDYVLYVINPSAMGGVYSIAEVVDDSNKRPDRTVFCILGDSGDRKMDKSLSATAAMVIRNGANVFNSLEEVAAFLNGTQHAARFENGKD